MSDYLHKDLSGSAGSSSTSGQTGTPVSSPVPGVTATPIATPIVTPIATPISTPAAPPILTPIPTSIITPIAAPVTAAFATPTLISISTPVFHATKRMRIAFILTLFLSALIANFVFWSGFSLGFFITVVMAEAALFVILPKPASKKNFMVCLFLAGSVLALGATFFIYSDEMLAFIDFLTLVFLFFVQLLVYSETIPYDWDHPLFFLELLVSPFIRPFIGIPSLIKVGRSLVSKKASSLDSTAAKRKSAGIRILIGLLIAFPVMIVVILLLSSADAAFKMIFQSFLEFMSDISSEEIMFTVFLTAFCFPFVFSLFFSYVNKWKDPSLSKDPSVTQSKKVQLDSIVAATFLSCVNILYGIFTFVQFSMIFGAFQLALPENTTYAQYARQGFFQLAAITSLNLVFVVLAVLFTQRHSISGKIVRVLSLLLILFTFVQLASAAYRMKMYIDVFSLSKLRVLVSIFMGLIALLLLWASIKEFFPKFCFLKAGVLTAILVLLFTNFINTNALIARYNTARYFDADIVPSASDGAGNESDFENIDAGYLTGGLSLDSIFYIIPLMDVPDRQIAESVKRSLLETYAFQLKDYDRGDWRRFSLSRQKAGKVIEDYFGDKLESELARISP